MSPVLTRGSVGIDALLDKGLRPLVAFDCPVSVLVGIDALLDKGLRRNFHREFSCQIPVGIDALLDKGLRLMQNLICHLSKHVGIDALFDKGLRLLCMPASDRIVIFSELMPCLIRDVEKREAGKR